MINLVEIGKYIVKLRTDQNISQQQLADQLFVTHQAVSKWENGKAMPNIEIMVGLTKLFNITIDQLLSCGFELKDDFSQLIKSYPREYILNQLIKGEINFEIKNILYLLSNEEREMIINHIINHQINIDIYELLPYLNQIERRRIIQAIQSNKFNIKINDIFHMLTDIEKKLILRRKK